MCLLELFGFTVIVSRMTLLVMIGFARISLMCYSVIVSITESSFTAGCNVC